MARIYSITEGKFITTSPVGQARLLQNWFNEHKAGTVKEITDGIKDKLVTVQDPMRVVMFYMGYLKKQGKITEVSPEVAANLKAGVKKEETKEEKTKTKRVPKVKVPKDLPTPTPEVAPEITPTVN